MARSVRNFFVSQSIADSAEAAMQAVLKWRLVAATDGTDPISASTQVAITFRLTSV